MFFSIKICLIKEIFLNIIKHGNRRFHNQIQHIK